MGREQRDKAGAKTTGTLEGMGLKAGEPVHFSAKIVDRPESIFPCEYQIIISTGMNTQEEIRTLNDMAKKGYEHYLTVPLYGSTEKLYFRSYK